MIQGEWRLRGDGIAGWARSDEFTEPLWVELLADGDVVGIARADLPEPDGCGFWLPISASLLENECQLRMRLVNTHEEITRIKEDAGGSALLGELFVDRGLTLSGWVVDPDRVGETLRVIAYVDGRQAGEAAACARHYRPAQADGHGYVISLPYELGDGKEHTVELRDEYGRALPGSPVKIRSSLEDMGQWLHNARGLDKGLRTALGDILENVERRLPGSSSHASYASWKEAFPPPAPPKRLRAAISVYGNAALLKGQQLGDARIRDKDGEYVFFPGNAVKLHPFALAHMLAAIQESDAEVVYADGESAGGEPYLKPAWDREAFLAQDYLGPMLVKGSLARQAGIEAGEGQELARLKAVLAADAIRHVPLPLAVHALELTSATRGAAIDQWLQGACPGASWAGGRPRYALARKPRISVLIPTRDHGAMLARCLDSLKKTDWPDLEIIIIDNGSVEDDALAVLKQAQAQANICVLRRPGVFNYAELNNDAARLATGEYLCFLNNDTEVVQPQWLMEMAALLAMAGADGGCVGAKLLWPNGLVQHGGVIVGIHQLAAHVGNQWLEDEPGYMNRNLFTQRYSAVTAACMLTPARLFLENGGFDGRRFPIAFNDVDYCMRLGRQGKKIFWTPHAVLKHHESASRGEDKYGAARARAEREKLCFRTAWGHFEDPFYNPNLSLSAVVEPFTGLAMPPRAREPR